MRCRGKHIEWERAVIEDERWSMGEESLRSGLVRTRWAIQKDASRRLQTQTLEGG